jgi:hypothetical protein
MPLAMPNPIKPDRRGSVLKLHRNCGFGEVSIGTPKPNRLDLQGFVGDGETSSLYILSLGVPADSIPRAGARGGANNKAGRVSQALTGKQLQNLIEATKHAVIIGLPFNRLITVHWQATGLALEGMAKATGRFIDLMSKALFRHRHKTAWIWVHENGERKGGHAHILAHVPAKLAIKIGRLFMGWLRSITGKPYRKGVIDSRPIGGRLGLEIGNPALLAVNLKAALGYVLKGADAQVAQAHNLTRLEPGGLIIGKRCGTSQNIGPKARASHYQTQGNQSQ